MTTPPPNGQQAPPALQPARPTINPNPTQAPWTAHPIINPNPTQAPWTGPIPGLPEA
uniref:Uncharacterized protein n=1 Tax=Romanomermis culicivorax TaxID=13658 RepID=A0A915HHJ7_ROMCU